MLLAVLGLGTESCRPLRFGFRASERKTGRRMVSGLSSQGPGSGPGCALFSPLSSGVLFRCFIEWQSPSTEAIDSTKTDTPQTCHTNPDAGAYSMLLLLLLLLLLHVHVPLMVLLLFKLM